MSFLCLVLFIALAKIDLALITDNFLQIWALFSIGDALWVRNISGGKK